ncbi:DsbA family protein [Nitrosarchaeum koreense]|nr:DsbA family protein [Nitrosarchaeum koreense]
MKTSRKIGFIVLPIVILGIVLFISLQTTNILSFQSENELDYISSETNDFLSLNLPIIGYSDAPVTIIAFNDYQCKDCKTWYDKEYSEISKNLIETKKANIIFLDSISLGNDSVLISEATMCANDQEKYLQYQEILFASQQKIDDWAKSEQLKKFAMDLELDEEMFDACLDSGKYNDDVLSNLDYAKSLGVDQIPVFKIINYEGKEQILRGGLPNDVFEDIVNRFQ